MGRHRIQLQAGDILIVREARLDGDVAEIRIVGHRDDACRQLGRLVDRQRQRQAGGRRHVDGALPVRRARVRELRARIERRAHDGHRMVVHLRAAILCHGVRHARGGAVRRDVVSDVAVDAEYLRLRLLSLEVREVRRPRLLDAHGSAGDVDCAFVALQDEGLASRLGRHVLPEVAVRSFAFDDERLDGEQAIATAERGRGIVDGLLFGRAARAAADGDCRHEYDERGCTCHKAPIIHQRRSGLRASAPTRKD